MMDIDATELWRQIPPEEKFEMMANAHAKGMLSAFILVVVAGTLAVGLQIAWIMWGALIMSPFIFQVAAGKGFRDLRPRMMLEYLAARAAARRYAFIAKSKDLSVNFIFRGEMEQIFDDDNLHAALEASVANVKEAKVWVTLFGDALILMSERPGGANLEFAHLLNDGLGVESLSGDNKDYSNSKEILLSYRGRGDQAKKIKLTSKYPAALIVFEKRLLMLKKQRAEEQKLKILEAQALETQIETLDF